MYHMARPLGLKNTLRRELPAAATAFLIAELFYKFHSFALETLAFLVTWWVLGWIQNRLSRMLRVKETNHGCQTS